MDIIWGSFLTIFLCTWTVICLNIPASDDSPWKLLRRRLKWMIWAILAPEVVLTIAIGQYASARRSAKRFRALGHSHWTVSHGFFADMGGFILHQADDDQPPYPVNSRQLAYLVEKGYIACPSITTLEIWDRSKADTMAKLLTMAQASWMLVTLIGRGILQMATTTLELSAGAIVFCTFGTFICWLSKPSDIKRGVVLEMKVSTAKILVDAGDLAARPYLHTPLDFVAKQSFTIGYEVMGFFGLRCDDRRRPLVRLPNDRFPDISTVEKFALFCMTTAYSGLHLIAWKFWFPTKTEAVLWQASSLVMVGTTVFYWVFETIMARQRYGRWDKYWRILGLAKKQTKVVTGPVELTSEGVEGSRAGSEEVGATNGHTKLPKTFDKHVKLAAAHADASKVFVRSSTVERMDAFEMEQKASKPLPALEIMLLTSVMMCYVAARLYLIVEPLTALRELPSQVFTTFQLTQVLPHW
ncbi:hypothetical protein AMS68_006942 [Peltaster fructicola]|uniref:Wax synthase domain-containing protein n=1 Tax=Peltaster fructicola TaxID=286661 RepID=A0A6H0Y3B6_9PEZI|nr:hypothetical protein AMS68_006942 [Peltaster fructicola]